MKKIGFAGKNTEQADPEVTFFGGYTIASGDAFLEALAAEDYQIDFSYDYEAVKGNIIIRYFPNEYVIFDYKVSNRDGIIF